jgi:hypothetical protein
MHDCGLTYVLSAATPELSVIGSFAAVQRHGGNPGSSGRFMDAVDRLFGDSEKSKPRRRWASNPIAHRCGFC